MHISDTLSATITFLDSTSIAITTDMIGEVSIKWGRDDIYSGPKNRALNFVLCSNSQVSENIQRLPLSRISLTYNGNTQFIGLVSEVTQRESKLLKNGEPVTAYNVSAIESDAVDFFPTFPNHFFRLTYSSKPFAMNKIYNDIQKGLDKYGQKMNFTRTYGNYDRRIKDSSPWTVIDSRSPQELARNICESYPLHFMQYSPDRKLLMDTPPTNWSRISSISGSIEVLDTPSYGREQSSHLLVVKPGINLLNEKGNLEKYSDFTDYYPIFADSSFANWAKQRKNSMLTHTLTPPDEIPIPSEIVSKIKKIASQPFQPRHVRLHEALVPNTFATTSPWDFLSHTAVKAFSPYEHFSFNIPDSSLLGISGSIRDLLCIGGTIRIRPNGKSTHDMTCVDYSN